MIENDRRQFQRIRLARPILAGLRGESALILDVGLGGALIEHHGTAKLGERMTLAFRWQSEDLTFRCEVTRTTLMPADDTDPRQISQSAVQFVDPTSPSLERLQEMMATFVGRVLAAQRANAAANVREEAAILPQLGGARRSRTRGFVAYLYDGKSWIRRQSRLSDQPRNGFTVPAYEDEEELEALCRAYETADEEGRRLIRLVAELSVASVEKTPS